MTRKTAATRGVAFGGPTVLTVLLILCLTCFSLLALSRAADNWRLTERGAQTVSDYYAAASQTELVLSLLDDMCGAPPDEAGPAMAERAAQNGAQAEYDAQAAELCFAFSAGAQGDLVTHIVLTAEADGTAWRVRSSRVEPEDQPDSEAALPVHQ